MRIESFTYFILWYVTKRFNLIVKDMPANHDPLGEVKATILDSSFNLRIYN